MSDSIKVITTPDIIFDDSYKLLAVNPFTDLKQSIENWAVDQDYPISIYYYSTDDDDIKWLLTTANICDTILLEVDNCTNDVSSFLSYLISLSTTYYRTTNLKQPWNLLNQNRFFDFPELSKETNVKV